MNPARESTRLYIKPHGASFARLLWVRNHQPNEMMLGIYGRDGGPATITHEFPERVLTAGESGLFHWNWDQAEQVSIPLDHFSCHVDGRFHLKKLGGGPDPYSHNESQTEPLGPDSGVFLNLIVVSDRLSSYSAINGVPKYPNVWVEATPDATLGLKCLFAGVNCALESRGIGVAAARPMGAGVVVITSSTLKGVVVASPFPLSADAERTRPRGTLIIFRWPREDRSEGHKAFMLS